MARSGPHHTSLFPFGAAPFRLQDRDPVLALVAALAAPIFNIVVGGVLLFFFGPATEAANLAGLLAALLVPVGWLNLWVGLINIIPGLPFDGGLALAASFYVFTNDREGGFGAAQAIGRAAILLLVLVGAWQGLTSDRWLLALALVVAGWAANEAANASRQRRILRGVFSQMRASDLMEASRPDDVVQETQMVAALVKSHPHFPPNTPLAVLGRAGNLEGITTLAATERLLQGNWPTTPVRAITTPIDQLEAVSPGTRLVDVLAIAHSAVHAPSTNGNPSPDEEPNIAVIDDKKLVGSIDPNRLQTFEEAGRQFGVEEVLAEPNGGKPSGWLGRAASLIPVVLALALVVILGNIALHTDPVDLKQPGDTGSSIQFSNFRPADGDIVGFGSRAISVQVAGQSAVVSATITLDGQTFDTQLSGTSPMTRTVTASVPGLTLGPHTARINAVTESGDRRSSQWRFTVSSSGATGGEGTGNAQPTPVSSAAVPPASSWFLPAPGDLVLAGSDVTISVDITATQPLSSALITLDGTKIDTKADQVGDTNNSSGSTARYRISATAPAIRAGRHIAAAYVVGGSGSAGSTQWTFNAVMSDTNHVYFRETGYFVTEPFLTYWQNNGGLALFGYPVSGLIQETDATTGQVYTAQYFERARFEQLPSLGDQVVLGRLGALLYPPEPPVQPKEGYTFFPETGHNVSPAFLKYWNENGGLAVFGYPISEEHTEKNPVDGKEYTVQYFERNRFELHPEMVDTPFEVQLGLLGTQLYMQKNGP